MVVKDKLVVTDPPPPLPPPPPVVDPPMNPETGSVAEAQGCALSSRSSHIPTFPALLGVGSATIFFCSANADGGLCGTIVRLVPSEQRIIFVLPLRLLAACIRLENVGAPCLSNRPRPLLCR